jgi:hypothetical protein
MNYLLLPTLFIAVALFVSGVRLTTRVSRNLFRVLCALGGLLAIPGVLFAIYYLKPLGTSVWFYEFRSIPYTELTAGGAGLLAGLLHGRFSINPKFRRIAGSWFFPGVLGLGLVIPYIKPILRPLDPGQFQNRWSDQVCLQTSESSCGPACAATLLRHFGKEGTEAQIAHECFTSGARVHLQWRWVSYYLPASHPSSVRGRRTSLRSRLLLVTWADRSAQPIPAVQKCPAVGTESFFMAVTH